MRPAPTFRSWMTRREGKVEPFAKKFMFDEILQKISEDTDKEKE